MNIEALTSEFQNRAVIYKHLKDEAFFILDQALIKTNIKLHSITSRVKELESFIGKVQRKQVGSPFEEINDIVGLRVICLFLSDIAQIGEIIRNSFLVLSEDNKVEGTDVSSFGYMSVHFIVKMKDEYKGPRYDHIAQHPLEIQVRTIAMDAWANVSHYLDYKSDKDVPSDLKRDFYALSGLFYVADKHFEMFYGARKHTQEEMVELFEAATPQTKAEQEINLDSLTAYLHQRLPDRKHLGAKEVSSLVRELLEAGYTTIGDIEQMLENALDAFLRYEKDHPPAGGKFADVGVIRVVGRINDERYLRVSASQNIKNASVIEKVVSSENNSYGKYRKYLKKK